MGVIIGIDVGGSTTKIVGFSDSSSMNDKSLMTPLVVRATDPLTSLYGAFGKFTSESSLSLSDIECVMMTGVGAASNQKPIYSLESRHVSEFDCIGFGGLYLSGLDRAIVVSLGTGTAIVYAESGKTPEYLGGTGVGGGTLIGLSKKLIGSDNIDEIEQLASGGNLENIDLLVGDMTATNAYDGMSDKLTAANFGNISGLATSSDIALGLFNMVYETVGVVSRFAARSFGTSDIVVTGNLTTTPLAQRTFAALSRFFSVNFIIPENSQFATVIGAALSYKK